MRSLHAMILGGLVACSGKSSGLFTDQVEPPSVVAKLRVGMTALEAKALVPSLEQNPDRDTDVLQVPTGTQVKIAVITDGPQHRIDSIVVMLPDNGVLETLTKQWGPAPDAERIDDLSRGKWHSDATGWTAYLICSEHICTLRFVGS